MGVLLLQVDIRHQVSLLKTSLLRSFSWQLSAFAYCFTPLFMSIPNLASPVGPEV
jgi:hypothetical protein